MVRGTKITTKQKGLGIKQRIDEWKFKRRRKALKPLQWEIIDEKALAKAPEIVKKGILGQEPLLNSIREKNINERKEAHFRMLRGETKLEQEVENTRDRYVEFRRGINNKIKAGKIDKVLFTPFMNEIGAMEQSEIEFLRNIKRKGGL